MKYKCYGKFQKSETKGGSYWENSEYEAHHKLTKYQTTYQYFLKNYPPKLKVLEAGCGIGRWVVPLSEDNYDVTGIEIEEKALKIIRNNFISENLELVHGDILNMDFPDGTFDFVLSLGVLEHFENAELQMKAIEEHIRVLKDSGTILVTVPQISFLRLFIHLPYVKILTCVRRLKNKKYFFTEYRYSKNEFKKILESVALKVVDVVYDDFYPPYSFGLTVDYPLNRLTKSREKIEYKCNRFGQMLIKVLWNINPRLISGGIGFICKKQIKQH